MPGSDILFAKKFGGGGGVFLATYTITPAESGFFTVTCDKTYEELFAAYTSGQQLQARCLSDEMGIDLRLTSYAYPQDAGDGGSLIFLGIGRTHGGVVYIQVEQQAGDHFFVQVKPLATAD